MSRRSRTKESGERRRGGADAIVPLQKPLGVARALSVPILLIGVVMLLLGGGVAAGFIKEGWGFPMSSVPNWGRPWGLVLLVGALAYIIGPILLFARPGRGAVVMLVISGLSVLVGTPLITTATEIAYNLAQTTKARPEWVDSVWGYFMIAHVAIAIFLYRALPAPAGEIDEVPQR